MEPPAAGESVPEPKRPVRWGAFKRRELEGSWTELDVRKSGERGTYVDGKYIDDRAVLTPGSLEDLRHRLREPASMPGTVTDWQPHLSPFAPLLHPVTPYVPKDHPLACLIPLTINGDPVVNVSISVEHPTAGLFMRGPSVATVSLVTSKYRVEAVLRHECLVAHEITSEYRDLRGLPRWE